MTKGIDLAKSTVREEKSELALDERKRQKYDIEYLN